MNLKSTSLHQRLEYLQKKASTKELNFGKYGSEDCEDSYIIYLEQVHGVLHHANLGPARLNRFLDVSNGNFLYLENFGFLSQKLWFVTKGAAQHKFRP